MSSPGTGDGPDRVTATAAAASAVLSGAVVAEAAAPGAVASSARAMRFWRAAGRAGDHGAVWALATAVLVSRKGPSRRAGVRGATAAVATTTVVHLLAKPLLPRVRVRRVARTRVSAHAASAAAFAAGVAIESRTRGAVAAPVATAIAVARVRVGDRAWGEVLTGAALGLALSALTLRWWPVAEAVPARAGTAHEAPALGDGTGVVVMTSATAGTPASGSPTEEILAVLPAAHVVAPAPGADIVVGVEAALAALDARGVPARALGAAGGDGSVAAIAAIAEERGLPLVVVPAGTLNHFARDVGIPDAAGVLAAASEGSAVRVDLAAVDADGHRIPFVNTASLGGYPDMVRLREGWEDRYGKWPAALLALVRVLREATPMAVTLDGRRGSVWMLFVGNGIYHPRGMMAPVARPRLDAHALDVRYLRADLRFSRLRFLGAVVLGTMPRSRVYVQRSVTELDVALSGDPVALATDGEVHAPACRFRFATVPGSLVVYRPDPDVPAPPGTPDLPAVPPPPA